MSFGKPGCYIPNILVGATACNYQNDHVLGSRHACVYVYVCRGASEISIALFEIKNHLGPKHSKLIFALKNHTHSVGGIHKL